MMAGELASGGAHTSAALRHQSVDGISDELCSDGDGHPPFDAPALSSTLRDWARESAG